MNEPIYLSITIYGLAIVISFLVAALIKGIVVALPLLRREDAVPVPRPAAPDATAVPPEHLAAIAAAVAAVVGPRHIIHIEDRGRATAWSAEGRMIHQTSHAVTRTPKR
ncbi:MAG: hypothetical protein QNJ30_07535 [Kiloniellales bacterium]|nr:hypothetical protein [Kiloniellales bacterium]